MGKYDGLRELLASAGDRPVTLSFDQIAEAVGGLPPSARQHPAWWGNHAGNPQARGWMNAGRRVETFSLDRGQVRFSAPTVPFASSSEPAVAVEPPPLPAAPEIPDIRWDDVLSQVAADLRGHLDAGRGHLITEDVVRFATALALQAVGIPPSAIRFEVRVPEIAASLDLVVGDLDVVVELKYPRDPEGAGAADTMTYGEVLRDFYRLAWLDGDAWALQVMDARLRGYLSRRPHVAWTWTPGETMNIRPDAMQDLPLTTARSLPRWTATMAVDATCVTAHQLDGLILAAYRVHPA